jgi:hypothetical protein
MVGIKKAAEQHAAPGDKGTLATLIPRRSSLRRHLCRAVGLIGVLFMLSACAQAASTFRCRQLQATGQMFSTIDSCRKCVESLGDTQVEAIQGCALGLDAGMLIDLGNQGAR